MACADPERERSGERSRERTGGEFPAVIEDGEGAIEPLVDVHAGFRITGPVGIRENLERAFLEGDSVVVGDDASVLEAKDRVGVEAGGPGAIGGLALRRGPGEAGIVAGEEVGEEGIGRLLVADTGEAEFDDETILQSAEEALDAPLGLGAGGGDPGDAEFVQHAADLGGGALALQLLGERPAGVSCAFEDAVPIGVDGEREAGAAGELAKDLDVAVSGFLRVEPPGEHMAGRIIDESVQNERGAALLQPGMVAAIALDEHPRLRHALASAAMARGTAGAWAVDAGGPENTVEGGPGEDETLLVLEELTEVLEVHPRVGRPHQAHEALAEGIGHARGRDPTLIAMDECGGPPLPIGRAKALRLPDGSSQKCGGLSHVEFSALESVEDHETLRSVLRQGHHTPVFV